MIISPHNQVGRLLKLLIFGWFLTKSVFHDFEVKAKSLAVGNLSEIGVEVWDRVVGEVGDEGTGDDEGGEGGGK